MLFLHPDDAIRWYFRQQAELGAPSLQLVLSEFNAYDAACTKCGSTIRHTKTSNVKTPTEVCGGCGAVWGFEKILRLKGAFCTRSRRGKAVPAPRTGSSEHRLSVYVDVGALLGRLYDHRTHKWAIRILCASVLGASVREIARDAPLAWPRARIDWNPTRVYRLIDSGRTTFGQHLERAHLLEHSALWQMSPNAS